MFGSFHAYLLKCQNHFETPAQMTLAHSDDNNFILLDSLKAFFLAQETKLVYGIFSDQIILQGQDPLFTQLTQFSSRTRLCYAH